MAPSDDDGGGDDEVERMAAASDAIGEADTPERGASAGGAVGSSPGGDSTEDEVDDDSNEDEDDSSSNDDDDDDGSADDSSSSDDDEDDDDEDEEEDNDDDEDEDGDTSSNEDAEPMEVEAVPTEDQDDEDDDEGDEDGPAGGSPSAAAFAVQQPRAAAPPAAVPATADVVDMPPPAKPAVGPPKMRIKLSLKARLLAFGENSSPGPAPAPAPAPAIAASSSMATAAAAPSQVKVKASSASHANADDDVVMAEAHDGEDHEDDDEVIATAEVVEDVPTSGASGKKSIPSKKSKSFKSTSFSPGSNNKMDSHPLHKPAKQRAPPPSLSRPHSKNPQLAYTSTSGQGGGYHTRAMRLPSVLSPGMLAVPNHSNAVGTAVRETEAYKMLHGNDGEKGTDGSSAGAAGSDDPAHRDPYQNYTTADSVFTYYMAAQGYTPESRSSNPHRGSSIRRTVGDMFDNDVMSSINFPKLLPDYLRRSRGASSPQKKSTSSTTNSSNAGNDGDAAPKESTPGKDGHVVANTDPATTSTDVSQKDDACKTTEGETPKKDEGTPAKIRMEVMDMLKSALTSALEKRKAEMSSSSARQGPAKRFRALQFEDMVPVSLTFPYPEEYTKARIEYGRKVQEREDAIAHDQTASQKAADIMDTYNREKANWEETLTKWEKDKAEHKDKLAEWEMDQIARREQLEKWEKGRAEVEAAAAALVNKTSDSPNKDAPPPSEAQAEENTEGADASTEHKDASSNPDTAAAATTDTAANTAGDGSMQADESVLGPPRPATPVQPKEPVLPPLPAPMPIPPIPVSPSPPKWADATSNGTECEGEAKGIQQPSPETLKRYSTNLAHLDPATYLSTVPTQRARYVGLLSNTIADANFVGPAAHGIAGIGLGLGSGLSTAYTGASGGQGGGGLHSSSYYEGLKRFADHMGYADANKSKASPEKKKSTSPTSSAGKEKNKDGKGKLPKIKLKLPPPPPGYKSAAISSCELKGLFETDNQEAEEMRITIIKATIYAARVGKSAGDKFVGSDGKVYSGIGRAFSDYAGVKPCERCRKSKQGALMCRVRRRHKDEDYDGGNSAAELQQYLRADLKTLIRKESSS